MVKKYKYTNPDEVEVEYRDKDVIIWGLSGYAIQTYLSFKKRGINVIGFADSYVSEEEQTFALAPLFSLKSVKELSKKRRIMVYIAVESFNSKRSILQMLDGIDSFEVVCRGIVYGPGLYDTEDMKRRINQDEAEIDFLVHNLADEESKRIFDNLLQYRMSNEWSLLKSSYEGSHQQYFSNEIVPCTDSEVFVDAGAYDGATSISFAEWVDNKYEKIYLLEPDEMMFDVANLKIKRAGIRDVEMLRKGAYSDSRTISFNTSPGTGSSSINSDGTNSIETISIDEMLDGQKATFIKMDIEGAEREALIGCQKTISAFRPKLAISVYHLEDDLWKIPSYILKYYPFYSLYIRHYTDITTETILYAVEE